MICHNVTTYFLEGHTVDMPVSNPSLTDRMIEEELKDMFDLDISDKRKGYSQLHLVVENTTRNSHSGL